MSKIEVRLANPSDVEYISLLGRITFSETFGDLFRDPLDLRTYLERTFSVAKIRKSLHQSTNVYWLALVDDLPVGYSKLKLNSSTQFISSNSVCQLQKIYVLKDFLSLKIGLGLQNKLLDKAKEHGFEKIWLSVLETNNRAVNFYKKNNFSTIAKHGFHIGKEKFHFIAMSKNLK